MFVKACVLYKKPKVSQLYVFHVSLCPPLLNDTNVRRSDRISEEQEKAGAIGRTRRHSAEYRWH